MLTDEERAEVDAELARTDQAEEVAPAEVGKQPSLPYVRATMESVPRAKQYLDALARLPRFTLEDIQGEELLLLDVKLRPEGEYGPYVIIHVARVGEDGVELDGVVITGATVLYNRCEILLGAIKKGECNFPLLARFVKLHSASTGRDFWDIE